MAGWESLRDDLRRLGEQSPGALVVFPSPETEHRKPPFHIELAAWATEIAATLHETYGTLVDLRVGAQTYPGGQLSPRSHWHDFWHKLAAAPLTGLEVTAPTPLSVQTGRSLRTDVLVTNHTDERQILSTNGKLLSAVVTTSCTVVGLSVAPSPARLVGFPIEPQETGPVPVLIGTASINPALGYAVPPGNWHLVIALRTANSASLSAPLPLTVTP